MALIKSCKASGGGTVSQLSITDVSHGNSYEFTIACSTGDRIVLYFQTDVTISNVSFSGANTVASPIAVGSGSQGLYIIDATANTVSVTGSKAGTGNWVKCLAYSV